MRLLLSLLCFSLVFVACGADASPTPAAGAGKPDAPAVALTTKPAENPALRDPAQATQKAPDVFEVEFETTKGHFVIEVDRSWSPHGADRFYNMVSVGYYNDVRIFRVVRNFVAQFGMHADPTVSKAWSGSRIPGDSVRKSNLKGTLTFAMLSDPNSRSNQLFINLKDNARLDNMGFAPVGKVTRGLDVVEGLYNGYGEEPSQEAIAKRGNAYLDENFPKLDAIKSAYIIAK
ncbi:MAG: peptidylprolyl isomerase [Planctomycetes bacterium]|nr:peptidylprolyl isomerase [Planctomycetota bacterium]